MENYAVYESKLGYIKMQYKDDCITYLKRIDNKPNDLGIKNEFTDKVFKEITEYINGTRKTFTFSYKLKGTEFQISVWNALQTIPYGVTKTYKEIATQIGNEKASRAVGMANNKNPITIVIPCHRVIGSNKQLVGYAGGLSMKKYLLDMESKNK